MSVEFKVPTVKEFMALEFPARDWGGWRKQGRTLYFQIHKHSLYDLDLATFTSSATLLNMILQVSNKTWATDACLAGLVRAVDDILHPQATLCSFGKDKRMTAKQVNNLIKKQERTE